MELKLVCNDRIDAVRQGRITECYDLNGNVRLASFCGTRRYNSDSIIAALDSGKADYAKVCKVAGILDEPGYIDLEHKDVAGLLTNTGMFFILTRGNTPITLEANQW